MKIVSLDENCMTIFLNKYYLKNLNFDIKSDLETYFKNLFLRLNKYYNINITGYYNIDVYIDENYGLIIKLIKEDVQYYDYFDNQIDMRISLKNKKFLYGVNDLFDISNLADFEIYLYNGKYYIDLLENNISDIDMMKLIEFSDIVYDNTIDNIRNTRSINKNMI